MYTITVSTSQGTYDIVIENNILHEIGTMLKNVSGSKKLIIITDSNVEELYYESASRSFSKAGYLCSRFSIPAGERSKSLDTLTSIYDFLSEAEADRGCMIAALGGGVVGDIAGFAAATYMRGIPYIQIPTTLLSQVDSSIGGKVGINTSYGKNLVGSFYQPKAVYIDPLLLCTLPDRELRNGLSEVIKYAAIKDSVLFDRLLGFPDFDGLLSEIGSIIYICCRIKSAIVQRDERDIGERMLLNFGHTFGHAIERLYNYDFYLHGEAVAIGMSIMADYGEKLGITQSGTSDRLSELLKKYGLPTDISCTDIKKAADIIALDKKRSDFNINLVLLRTIGDAFIKKVSIESIHKSFNELGGVQK
ncbi:MAG: 3-dehydroquinate synthase [Bacillota bacterium]